MKFNFTTKVVPKPIGIKVSAETYAYIKALCDKYGQTIGEITRILVETAIEEHKKQQVNEPNKINHGAGGLS